jgi:siderophore synthetase component
MSSSDSCLTQVVRRDGRPPLASTVLTTDCLARRLVRNTVRRYLRQRVSVGVQVRRGLETVCRQEMLLDERASEPLQPSFLPYGHHLGDRTTGAKFAIQVRAQNLVIWAENVETYEFVAI